MSIQVGDGFQPAGDPPAIGTRNTVWVVSDVWSGADGLPYARLVRGDDRWSWKTVAVGALLDRRYYRRVAPAQP